MTSTDEAIRAWAEAVLDPQEFARAWMRYRGYSDQEITALEAEPQDEITALSDAADAFVAAAEMAAVVTSVLIEATGRTVTDKARRPLPGHTVLTPGERFAVFLTSDAGEALRLHEVGGDGHVHEISAEDVPLADIAAWRAAGNIHRRLRRASAAHASAPSMATT